MGDLQINGVTSQGRALEFEVVPGMVGPLSVQRLDVGVPSSSTPATVVISYRFSSKRSFDGWDATRGVSFLWPTFCSNLFPCHTDPADGQAFTLEVRGVPGNAQAVFPPSIPTEVPSYVPAIAVGAYTFVSLGSTDAGTEVGYYTLPGEADAGAIATQRFRDVVSWFETTLGPYRFGNRIAAVDAPWGPGAYGGMEHHPYFHVAAAAFRDESIFAHETAHGWFGDGIRIKCWEDFVLSEGTSDYLMIRSTALSNAWLKGRGNPEP